VKLLLTAFGPFPGAPVNPTPALVAALARRAAPGVNIATHVFRTAHADVTNAFPAIISRHRPDAVILFGLAGRTHAIRIETTAHNGADRRKQDVVGTYPARADLAVAPLIRRTRLPASTLLRAVRRVGVPVRLSHDAGRYLCNVAYWHALAPGAPPAIFIHVPLARGRRTELRRAGMAILEAVTGIPKAGQQRRHRS
jgi:pyroglutamyl-peptidase